MVLDPIPQSLPVPFLGSRPQPPTSHKYMCIKNQWMQSRVDDPSMDMRELVFIQVNIVVYIEETILYIDATVYIAATTVASMYDIVSSMYTTSCIDV